VETRAQVKAETREAIRIGDILAGGELGSLKLNELYPAHYAKANTGTRGTVLR
jgi:hypothetical protein